MAIRTDTLQELDYRHLWHPYTDTNAYESGPFVCFDRAEGVYLFERDGRKVLDGISSWWSVALGHSHPHVVEAIREQAGVLQQSILGNQAHPLAIQLAARLAEITPAGLEHCYFAADGASATEAALKMAIQYWHNIGQSGKTRFVSLEEGYHGDTLGAVGVGFVPTFHAPFADAVVKSHVADMPHRRGNSDEDADRAHAIEAFKSMEGLVQEHREELAGVILEPLCQGAAGVRIYHPEYLRKVRALCDEEDLILIADEIAVGFGRTETLFACDAAGIVPDIMCLGKALTAGYLPASVAIANDKIYDSFRSDELHDRTFYDGHTFCGNPITSAAALAALDIFTSENIVEGTKPLARQLAKGMAGLARHDCVEYYQTLGMIGMIALKDEAGGATLAKTIARKAMALGLFIRPLGEVLYLWPPLVSTQAELAEMLDLFDNAIAQNV